MDLNMYINQEDTYKQPTYINLHYDELKTQGVEGEASYFITQIFTLILDS